MKSISVTDFSGGIQESSSPGDFGQNQWAKLKGVIATNKSTFESQWAAQILTGKRAVSTAPDVKITFNQIFPLETAVGTFLVGINTDGEILWAKVPPTTELQSRASNMKWHVPEVANYALNTTGIDTNYPNGTISNPVQQMVAAYPDKRFITPVPFEVYKYVQEPMKNRQWDVTQDGKAEEVFGGPSFGPSTLTTICPGVLIGCRRAQRGSTLGVFTTLSEDDYNAATTVPASYQSMLVAYVDSTRSAESWTSTAGTYYAAQQQGFTGSLVEWQFSRQGVVRLVQFPHFRRFPTRSISAFGTWPANTITQSYTTKTFPATQISKVIPVVRAIPGTTTSTSEEFKGYFPTRSSSEQPSGIKQGEFFHPYTYKNSSGALLPGTGIIPRANVGTMWNNQLILGDIEWRSDKAKAADAAGSIQVPDNSAFFSLNDDLTEPHKGSFYYSEDDIDKFDARSTIRVSSSDARIAGLHVIDNRLVCITTAGTELDGVITYSGNLGQIHPYGGSANPFAVRKQLVRGGVGVASHQDEGAGYSKQTCMWSEAGIAVFIDRLGGVFYTDGQTCDRLDRFGPKQPSRSTHKDTVAAVGKHLFVWRNKRLLCFAMVNSDGKSGSGCWTEIVAPAAAYSTDRGIHSMVGGANQLFMLVNGVPYRYAPDSPNRGTIAGAQIQIEVATQTFGDNAAHKKTSWLRVGFSFYTPTYCGLVRAITRGEGFSQQEDYSTQFAGNLYPPANPAVSYTVSANNFYSIAGHYDFVAPAGIGPQYVMSAEFHFTGHVVLKGFTAWASGEIPSRTEP